MKKLILIVPVCLMLLGCAATTNATKFEAEPRPVKTGAIDVYTSPQNIKRPYKEIALITAEEGWDDSEAKLTQKMIDKARELGADGIILLSASTETTGGTLAGSAYLQSNYNKTRASAIVYTSK